MLGREKKNERSSSLNLEATAFSAEQLHSLIEVLPCFGEAVGWDGPYRIFPHPWFGSLVVASGLLSKDDSKRQRGSSSEPSHTK